jgi:hypothetical protein
VRPEEEVMTRVHLLLPANLLRRFREQAAALLPSEPEPFHLALRCAAREAMLAHASLGPVDEPPATLVPVEEWVPVFAAVTREDARFVAHLAARSGLTTQQAWHRVVLEFCERSEAPGIPVVPHQKEAA